MHHIIETMDQEKYAFIFLNKGYRGILDQKFYDNIKPNRWHAATAPHQAGSAYARTTQIKRDGVVPLHNYVLSLYLRGKDDASVKHISFNNKLSLDCWLERLLKNTGRQTVMRNRKGKANTSSQYKGARPINGKWRGEIMDGRSRIS